MAKRTKRPYREKYNEKPSPMIRTIVMEHKGFSPKIKSIGNSEFQVFPAVLLVEGVHQGVGTDPVYYPPASLQAVASMWNNIPVTIGHPVDSFGNHIMVNHDGSIQQQWAVGHVMGCCFEDGKLKAEVWIDQSKVNKLAPGLIEFLQNGGQLEVSTGLLSLDDGQAGCWNEEDYTASVMEIVPDHFALLPGGQGACSWDDGCGIRWNASKQHKIIFHADLQQTVDKVRVLVDSMDVFQNEDWTKMNFVRAVYSNYFVYQEKIKQPGGTVEEKMLKQRYSLDTDSNIVLEGEPEEVVEKITYKIKANKEESKMAKKKNEQKCCEKRVDALIANESNGFVEGDKEWLSIMNEEQIEKLEAVEIVEKEVEVVKEVENTSEESPTDLAGWLKTVPGEIQSVVNSGLRELDNKRASIIGKITGNEKNSFTEDQLKEMDISMLESISALLPSEKAPNFEVRHPAGVVVNEGEEPYIPVTLSDTLGKTQ